MKTWFKYAISFFALVLVLAGFIYAFGPASTRVAARSGESATGQLNSNAHLTTPGEPVQAQSGTTDGTSQGTTLPADGSAMKIAPAQQGAQPLSDGPHANPVTSDQTGR